MHYRLRAKPKSNTIRAHIDGTCRRLCALSRSQYCIRHIEKRSSSLNKCPAIKSTTYDSHMMVCINMNENRNKFRLRSRSETKKSYPYQTKCIENGSNSASGIKATWMHISTHHFLVSAFGKRTVRAHFSWESGAKRWQIQRVLWISHFQVNDKCP